MANFPTLTGSVRTHRDWNYTRAYRTSREDMDTGKRHSYYHRATPLMRWRVGGESLPDADVVTLRAFFAARFGGLESFTFTDPETASPYTAIFTGDFDVRANGPNDNTLWLDVAEIG